MNYPLDYHTECYKKLPETVAVIEKQKLADQVEVYTRDAVCLYPKELAGDKSNQQESGTNSLEHERERKLTDEERSDYKASWENVFEYMKMRVASKEEFEGAESLADRFIKEA